MLIYGYIKSLINVFTFYVVTVCNKSTDQIINIYLTLDGSNFLTKCWSKQYLTSVVAFPVIPNTTLGVTWYVWCLQGFHFCSCVFCLCNFNLFWIFYCVVICCFRKEVTCHFRHAVNETSIILKSCSNRFFFTNTSIYTCILLLKVIE